MTDITFAGRSAIVTGAGGGLGRAYALELARRGARVLVNDLHRAREVVDEIRAAGGEAAPCDASVSSVQSARAIVEAALDAFGTVDVLINNAGIVRDRSFAKMSHDEVDEVLQVHLKGLFNVTLPAYDVMKEKGYGRLLFVTSASGLFGNFGQANYAAAKAGVVGLTRTLAIEGARYGINANAIAPLAHTAMTAGLFGGAIADFEPEHVVPMAIYLVSEASSLSGEIYSAGGGRYARVLVGVTRGWVSGDGVPTVEEISEHIDDIGDQTEYVLPRTLADEIELARSML